MALAPEGNPVALSAAVHAPPDPVNVIFTDVPALAPYCADPPTTTGFGVWAPSTSTLAGWSTVVKKISDDVHGGGVELGADAGVQQPARRQADDVVDRLT